MVVEKLSATEVQFIEIPREVFSDDGVKDFDLFIQVAGRFVLYRSTNIAMDENVQARLLTKGIDTLYVKKSQQAPLDKYLSQHLRDIVADEKVPEESKARILYSVATSSLESFFQDPAAEEDPFVDRIKDATAIIVDQAINHPRMLAHLARIASHDFKTYTHSVNVCAYAVALAHRLEALDRKQLNALALGAVFHDLGKTRIQDVVLNKPAALSAEEWETIRRHPVWGVEMIREAGLVDEVALGPVLEHHERMNGDGYPFGVRGNDISLMGRITKVADVFDALTSFRPYRLPLTPFQALSTMRFKMAGHFDMPIFYEFVRLLGGVVTPRKVIRLGTEDALDLAQQDKDF